MNVADLSLKMPFFRPATEYLQPYAMSIPSHDIEGQTIAQHNGAKTARLVVSFWFSLSSGQSEVPLLLRAESRASFSDRAGQYCFLCLQGKKTGQYAVQVLCMRPTKPRAMAGYKLRPKDDILVRYEKLNPKELACESDAAIYQRLQDTCFQFQGTWKKWLPFYGVVDVREVNFQFVGVVERDGRFPIHILPSKVNQVRDDADRVISLSPHDLDIEFGEACWDEWHSTGCQAMVIGPCINVQIEVARQRKKKLTLVHLLRDCARNPRTANGLHTLDGMAQDSCIIDIEGPDRIIMPEHYQRYDKTDEVRGLEFVLGWQLDRIAWVLPINVAWVWFSLAATWLCVVAWAGPTAEWATAMSFGQLLVAPLSLLFLHSRS